ncbi:MAG: hypothetical protein A3D74_00305 [Candidatus Levybacteria bacterium RIFCSPHIGHO2_02_FULL_37_13]|nr:MAG: hypothetical protein A3D74_00305 [Candidatus Levybacteria bacterium RIFCSPHIGHO2_02_FULL_37_13]OGH29750.1 MAG: hypothetical protein A3E40_03010 [Candidatus Levybacteria bacterium RIFCSPHIGHO2_12_FULL_37_9]OGH39422.1 MAG: hypothetical protein A3B41_01490 [Candidatus Levybacteria bacterium RIFCSPLOWO2_01_FULL_37_26]
MDKLNQQAPVPQTQEKSHGSKLMLFIFGAVTILIGLGAYMLGANKAQAPVANNVTSRPSPVPTIDEASNWKTYVNKKIGFEIKYPSPDRLPYVTVGDAGGQSKNVDGTEDNTVIQFPGLGPKYELAFSLELFPYNGILEDLPESPAQMRLFYSGIDYSGLDKPPVYKKVAINDYETIWFNRTETEDKRKIGEVTYEIYLVAKNHAFIFHINSELSENDIDQILSTFKFTNTEEQIIMESVSKDLVSADRPGFQIEVKKVLGNYAYGIAGVPPGGFVWYAVKQNNQWKKIWDGQNIPPCSIINTYNVPKEIYKDCSDNY